MTKTQSNKIIKLLSTINIELLSENIIKISDIDELEDYLKDNQFLDVEVIYYSEALKILEKFDPSLQLSCGIAADKGIETKDITSELLASLIESQKLQEYFSELRDELEKILA